MSDVDVVQRTIDGCTIEADLHAGGEHGAILLHGLASQRSELGPWPGALADRGLTVLAPDLRGHGASQGQRGRLGRKRVLSEIRAWIEVLEEQGARLSVLGGHSTGGLWTLYAAPRVRPDLLATVATPASIRWELNALEVVGYRAAGLVDRAIRRLGGPSLYVPYQVGPGDVLDDPDAIERARALDLPLSRIPLVNVDELLALDGPTWARKIEQPTLVAYAENDRLVDRAGTRKLYEALAGPRTWMGLPGPHSCFMDVDGRACAEEVADWIAARIEATPSQS